MMFRILFFYFLLFSFSVFAEWEHVGEIIIRGNKIVETEAVYSKITSKKNKRYDARKVRRDARQIFNTGWFYNVEVQKKKRADKKINLIYTVKEKPIVEKIVYKGNKSLSKKELNEIFLFSPNDFLNHKKIRTAIKSFKAEYEKKGYYLVEISHSIKQTSYPEKVHLVIHIKENKKVKVNRIQLTGNKHISSKEIKSLMGTREWNLLSFISSAGSYSQDILEKDLNNIRFIYMDRGYWKVFVGKPEVVVSPDKTDLTISIPIQEGEQYKAGTIGFSGDLIFDTEYLKEGMETEESEILSYGKLQRDIRKIEAKYGDKGYAFVNVVPQFFNLPNEEGHTIHLLFDIQKGKKVRIGMIHIRGNSYTRDKVIRREIRIFEGELYSETNKRRSTENIRRLGFFDDVKIIPKTIKNRDDLVDMEVAITERENTGTLEMGAGYDGYFGFSFHGKIHKFNLFGRGYNIGLDANLNQSRQYINLSFSDPYFLDSRWYFGSDFYLDHWRRNTLKNNFPACVAFDKSKGRYRNNVESGRFKDEKARLEAQKKLQSQQELCWSSFPNVNNRGFAEKKIGGGITFGRSLTDTLKLLFYYRLETVELTNTIDNEFYPVDYASGFRNPVEAIVEYDERNDRLFPTAGAYSRSSIIYDGVFGKFDYFTLSTNFRFYRALFWEFIFRMNVQYSQHLVFSDNTEAIPFDRLFLLGGIDSLRGFKYFSVGPRKKSDRIYQKALWYEHPHPESVSELIFGGRKEFYTNLELQFPVFPGAQLLGVLFVDIGTAYNELQSIDLRGNWGFGLRFFSPAGPIRLEMGFPFSPQPEFGEGSSEFQFTIGLPF